MGFFSSIIGATVQVVFTPLAVVKDVVNVATGQEVDATKNLLSSAKEDAEGALEDLGNLDF